MKIIGCRFGEDDSIVVDWFEESEQQPNGGSTYSTVITEEAMEWQHVKYYFDEVVSDLEELVGWFIKYRSGRFEDSG